MMDMYRNLCYAFFLCLLMVTRTNQQPTHITENDSNNVCMGMDIYSLARKEDLEIMKEEIITTLRSDMKEHEENIKAVKYIINLDEKSWSSARQFCKDYLRGDLVSINSVEQWKDIVETIKLWKPNHNCSHFWTSGHRLQNGTWIEADGSNVVEQLWGNNQPNLPSAEHCLVLKRGDKYKYHDGRCSYPHCYICVV